MAEPGFHRRLAAILVADVVGYSRLMEADEAGTLSALRERRKTILEPVVKQHGGRIVKVMGDGVLVEFASAVNAVKAALELQARSGKANDGVAEDCRILLRIGINLGDVVGEGSDIYGDGVNIAARLEAVAEPGGICISAKVHDEVRGKVANAFKDLGDQPLKNIAVPVRAFAVVTGTEGRTALPLPSKPSIAVLAFDNLSGDAEQDYFADGMVDEIITALSRMHWLFVIARNSSFAYKGRAVDVKQIGRELGVRYVLEGSVRKAGDKVRIMGQLIDASTGAHLWADRFDGGLEDIFDLQDQVTMRVVGAIGPKLEEAEITRAKLKPTNSLGAYEYYLRGMASFYRLSGDDNRDAISEFYRAIELDPNFAAALGMAARCYAQRKAFAWATNSAADIAEVERLARRAAELGRNDAVALTMAGNALAYVVGDLEYGDALLERALTLNPNLASTWLFGGWIKVWLGEHEKALGHLARAMRLSPQDPNLFNMQAATGSAHFFAGRHAEAWSWASEAMRSQPNYVLANTIAAASAAQCDRLSDARESLARLRQFVPTARISNLTDLLPIRRAEDLFSLANALRKAGLPE